MSPRGIATRCLLAFFLFRPLSGPAQIEPQGALVYQPPASSYIELLEYRSFQQDNPLYCSVVTSSGERKQLKSAGVLAVLSYPPASFDEYFAGTAQAAIKKVESLEGQYPGVRGQLEPIRQKWTRALGVFEHGQKKPAISSENHQPTTLSLGGALLQDARMTRATLDTVTVIHASGITTLPIAGLTAAQILALNRNSDKVQLPLGVAPPRVRPALSPQAAAEEGALTQRIAKTGQAVVGFCAGQLGVSPAAFTAWTFFVVLPGAVLLLLVSLILARHAARRVLRVKEK